MKNINKKKRSKRNHPTKDSSEQTKKENEHSEQEIVKQSITIQKQEKFEHDISEK